jgi:hypothetical protein
MKTINTFGVHFVARPKKANPDELLLNVRIYVSIKVAVVSIKRAISKEFWDQSNGCVRVIKNFKGK